MKILKTLFGEKESRLKLKYDKLSDQWQVLNNVGIVYLGSKESCENYISNFSAVLG